MNDTHKYSFKALLLIGDLAAFGLALVAGMWLRYHGDALGLFTDAPAPWTEMFQVLPYALLVYAVVLRFIGLYNLHRNALDEALRLLRAIIVTFAILLALTFFYRDFSYSRAVVLMMVPATLVGTILLRAFVRFVWHQVLQLDPVQGMALLIGTGPVAEHLADHCRGRGRDYEVGGVVCIENDDLEEFSGLPVVGRLEDLGSLLSSGRYQVALVADPRLSRDQHLEIAERCMQHSVQYHVVPDIFELMLDRVQVNMVGGLPLMGLKASNLTGLNFLIKRMFDLVVATVVLLAAGPLMLITAIGIKLSSKGPVFFVQERVGLHGRSFKLVKFRSMHAEEDLEGVQEYARDWVRSSGSAEEVEGKRVYKMTNDPRIFRVGAFIRKYSIDELPQMFNVFRGDMSLVGPRPPVPYEVEVYREWHRRRFEALPGITGLWQVSGRNRLSFDEMVKLDVEYIEHWSLELDLRIAFRTVGEVLSGGGF